MEDFKSQVKKGFQNCRTDINTLKVENDILKEKINSQEKELSELKAEIKGIQIALDYIKEFNKNITQAPIQKPQNIVEPSPVEIPKVKIETKDPYEALLAFKAKSNKRELLKQKLTSMISENGMNLSELKFLFVEHYKYCSKATFYNYLKELELERIIQINRENSKNFVYLANMINKEI
jgi:septal ring factor EnvC (AmiA/AmiB activator)